MRNQVTIRWAAIAFLVCCMPGQSLGQTLDRPTTPTSQSAPKRQGFFDYALGKINPDGIDYGASMESGRNAVVENTIDDLYFWSNVVTLLLLSGLVAIVLLQWRAADKREVIAASLIAQLWNGRVSDRIEIERRTQQFNQLVEAHNADVEKNLSQKPGPSQQDAEAAGSELDKLLTLFHDENRVLPGLSFERIWFLHSLRGPERMLQTRAVRECLQRSWRHVRPRSQLRDELVGYELTRHERSILLPAEGGLVQRRGPDVGKAPPSLRDLSWPGPLQFEKRIRSGVPIARRRQDFLVLGAPPIRRKDAPVIRAPRTEMAPDAYLVTLKSAEHGAIQFAKPGWKSAGVRPISISLRGERYEAMLLFGSGDWVESDLGRWLVDQSGCRIRLNVVREGALR